MPKEEIQIPIDIKAITNGLQTGSVGLSFMGNDIIPYGSDNNYPSEIFEAIRLSPTAKGCVGRKTQFVFGLGVDDNGIIVNRHGETLNQVLKKSINTYSWIDAIPLHFNYNLLGEIVEIQSVDIRFVRKKKDGEKVSIDKFHNGRTAFLGDKNDIFLYDPENLASQIESDGGFDEFKGNIYYWTPEGTIYTLSSADASLNSAQLENKVQIFNYATIENGFSASGLVKIPQLPNGENKNNFDIEIARLQGAENAGSVISVEVPQNINGDTQSTTNMFEAFTIPNNDKMFVEQNKHAKESILKEFRIPEILLGTSPDGMFNQASFEDASNYYNKETESDRLQVQECFNRFWDNTIFKSELSEIIITPLDMQDGSTTNND